MGDARSGAPRRSTHSNRQPLAPHRLTPAGRDDPGANRGYRTDQESAGRCSVRMPNSCTFARAYRADSRVNRLRWSSGTFPV